MYIDREAPAVINSGMISKHNRNKRGIKMSNGFDIMFCKTVK